MQIVLIATSYFMVTISPTYINWIFIIISLLILYVVLGGLSDRKTSQRAVKMSGLLVWYAGLVILNSVLYFLFTKQTFIKSKNLNNYPNIKELIDSIIEICDFIGLRKFDPTLDEQFLAFGIMDNFFISYLVYLFFGKMIESYYSKRLNFLIYEGNDENFNDERYLLKLREK